MFIKDPCGISCIIVTYVAVFYADYVIIKWIILQTMQNRYIEKIIIKRSHTFCIICNFSLWGPINVVAFNTIIFMLAMAHLKAVLTDPGTVPLPQTRLDFSDIHSSEIGKDDIDNTHVSFKLYFIRM